MAGRKDEEDVAIEDASSVQSHRCVEGPAFVEEFAVRAIEKEGLIAGGQRDNEKHVPPAGSPIGRGVHLSDSLVSFSQSDYAASLASIQGTIVRSRGSME